jgi:unspecific monooxygenase
MTTDVTPEEGMGFNPFAPGFRENPYPSYNRMRDETPVFETPFGLVLSRHADISAVLRDPRMSTDGRKRPEFAEWVAAQGLDLDEEMNRSQGFLSLDPPDHTRLRGLVSKAFTPRVVEQLRPRIAQFVEETLDRVAPTGEMDVIEDLAYPLPVQIICEMLGVPPEDHLKFREWSREIARALDPDFALTPEELKRREERSNAFGEFFDDLIEKRRADRRDDLISALISVEEEGDRLTHDELISTCVLLLIAGHETTVNLIGNGALALLRNPEQLAMLRENPDLAKTATEEVLRYDPPVQMTARNALEDMEFDGKVLKKGQQAILLLGAANRDPAQFSDPERLDITREDNRHLAFGMGIHFCLGAPLARVEGQIALSELVRRLPDLELVTNEPPYKVNMILRGLESLPVRFTAP